MNDGLVETGTLAILNKSEIDQQISTAKAYPRDISKCRDRAMQLATMNEAVASECIYALPREDKVIEGPSARFAEILASTWGNCRAGARITEEGHEFVTAQGIFHDLESNSVITYETRRRITNKSGRRFNADMIGVTANAACSIALRNAILKGVPKALWSEVYEATRHAAAGTQTTIHNRRADAIKAFAIYGVDEDRLLARLGCKSLNDVTSDHITQLRGIYNAIREGEVTPETAFPAATDAQPAPAGQAPKTIEQFAATPPHDPDTGEVKEEAPPAPEPKPKKEPQQTKEEPVSEHSKQDAYKRGVEARKAGMLLRAVPPEYRAENRRDEVSEWKRGWMDQDYKDRQQTQAAT